MRSARAVVCPARSREGSCQRRVPPGFSGTPLRPHPVADQAADIVAVAAWLGDTVQTVHRTYAHLMPDADDRGRKAMDEFFKRAGDEGSA